MSMQPIAPAAGLLTGTLASSSRAGHFREKTNCKDIL